VYGVAFSPDGNLLASASDAGTLRLWDSATRQPSASLEGQRPGAGGGILARRTPARHGQCRPYGAALERRAVSCMTLSEHLAAVGKAERVPGDLWSF